MSPRPQFSIAGLLTATTIAAMAAASFRVFPPGIGLIISAVCLAFGSGLLTSYCWPGVVGGLALIVVVVLQDDDPRREGPVELAALLCLFIGFLPLLLAAYVGRWLRDWWAEWKANT